MSTKNNSKLLAKHMQNVRPEAIISDMADGWYITIPSKANGLLKEEVEFMFPDKPVPIFPDGITRYDASTFRVRKYIKGKDYSLGLYKDLSKALQALSDFCDKHKIKM